MRNNLRSTAGCLMRLIVQADKGYNPLKRVKTCKIL